MRQIYTSQRQSNIDAVVKLLGDNGIETRITNRSNYKGADWKRFSYSQRNEPGDWPQVWVVNSNDQVRARELLREAGLEPAVRYADELAQARSVEVGAASAKPRHQTVAGRARTFALAVVVFCAAVMALRSCGIL